MPIPLKRLMPAVVAARVVVAVGLLRRDAVSNTVYSAFGLALGLMLLARTHLVIANPR